MEKIISAIREDESPITYLFISDKDNGENISYKTYGITNIAVEDSIKTSNLILIETEGDNILITSLPVDSSLEFKKAVIREIRSAKVIEDLSRDKWVGREYKSLGDLYVSLNIEDLYYDNNIDPEEKIYNRLLDKIENTSEKTGSAISIFNPNTGKFIVKSKDALFKIIKL